MKYACIIIFLHQLLFWSLPGFLITDAYGFIWIQHVKLRRATEQINIIEGKLQQALNENAKLKVKQTEDSKLWQGLDSKLSSTKTLCDQLTETLQQLASQTEQGKFWWYLLFPTVVQIWLVKQYTYSWGRQEVFWGDAWEEFQSSRWIQLPVAWFINKTGVCGTKDNFRLVVLWILHNKYKLMEVFL